MARYCRKSIEVFRGWIVRARTFLARQRVKNIQIVSSTDATEHELFAATEEEFALFFRSGENIAFVERVARRTSKVQLFAALSHVLGRPVIQGPGIAVHGVLFYELRERENEPI